MRVKTSSRGRMEYSLIFTMLLIGLVKLMFSKFDENEAKNKIDTGEFK
mgnify:CR=1 FL=1